jgi:hypothetical protein
MNQLPPSFARIVAKYKTNFGHGHESHDLRSLAARLLLSKEETLQIISEGSLLSLDCRNGRHVFSARSLDVLRNRVCDYIADEIVTELSRRGVEEDRLARAIESAFARQFDLARGRGENIVEFAITPQDRSDDDNNTLRNAALLGGGAAAGYAGYRYLKNRNGNGNALPGSGTQPLVPTGQSSNGSAMNERHPGAPAGASINTPIATASSTTRKTIGNSVIDPLSGAVASGRRAIAQRGSSIWQALRGIALE